MEFRVQDLEFRKAQVRLPVLGHFLQNLLDHVRGGIVVSGTFRDQGLVFGVKGF